LGKDPAAVGKMMTALIGGSEFGIWEMDVSISPVLVFLLFFRIRKSLGRMIKKGRLHRPVLNLKNEQVYAWVVLIFGLWLTFEFTSARGVFYPLFRDLPVLRSLHNNIRYSGSFILPLAILGAYFFDDEINQIEPPNRFKVYSFFLWGTLIWLGVYFFLPNDLQSRNFNIEQTLSDYQRAKAGEKFYISEVKNIFDHQVISNRATSLFPYDPLFGYNLEDFSTKLQPGSIYQVEDGFFNLTNPRSLVYDSDETFARFTTDQREMMEQFAHYQQPDWDIPRIQHTLNAISGITLLIILGYGLFLFVRRFYVSWSRN
jgi:hypothetical protein